MKSIFQNFSSGLEKTRNRLRGALTGILSGAGGLNEDILEEIEAALIQADIGVNVVSNLMESLKIRIKNGSRTDELFEILREEILSRLSTYDWIDEVGTDLPAKPYVIMITGVNGTGKTTTIGKLGYMHTCAGRSVLLAAADTFRAAANEQLKEWANRSGAGIVKSMLYADPGAVAYDALVAARSRNTDVLIVDTAGRLHTRKNLMEELTKVKRVLGRDDDSIPHEILLVIDATTGQNAIKQASEFNESLGLTGIVLAKLDGTAKGGSALAIQEELGIPVKYVGLGENLEDLEPFDPEAFASSLFYEEQDV